MSSLQSWSEIQNFNMTCMSLHDLAQESLLNPHLRASLLHSRYFTTTAFFLSLRHTELPLLSEVLYLLMPLAQEC